MYIYAQHGYGKSDKIETGLRAQDLAGVILQPLNERPDRLAVYTDGLHTEFNDAVEILVDPQFYLLTRSDLRRGYLADYPYYHHNFGFTDLLDSRNTRDCVRQVLDHQNSLQVTSLVSPTVRVESFDDRWYPIAIQLAQESMRYREENFADKSLLISYLLDESALKNSSGLDEFLDIISIWDVRGFYVIVNSAIAGYPAVPDAQALANLMYLTFILASENPYQVVHGYCDFVALPLHAVGATATATGWYQSLRQFSLERFAPSTGGRKPTPRYTSMPLLSSLKVVPELDSINSQGMLSSVLSGTTYDAELQPSNLADSWPDRTSCLHHWAAISDMAGHISAQGSVAENLDFLADFLAGATELNNQLLALGIPFATPSGSQMIAAWQEAIVLFRQKAGF